MKKNLLLDVKNFKIKDYIIKEKELKNKSNLVKKPYSVNKKISIQSKDTRNTTYNQMFQVQKNGGNLINSNKIPNFLSGNNSPKENLIKFDKIVPKNIIELKKYTRNKSSSISTVLKNSLNNNINLTSSSFVNLKNANSNSNLNKNSIKEVKPNLNDQNKQFYLKKNIFTTTGGVGGGLNRKKNKKINGGSNFDQYNSHIIKSKRHINYSNSHISIEINNNSNQLNTKNINQIIPKNSAQTKIKSTIVFNNSDLGSEKNILSFNKKEIHLDNSVTIISNRLMSELTDLETNLEKRLKNSNSTKDNSVLSLIIHNKILDTTNIEDIHSIFVKFYQQSRKILKLIEKSDHKFKENISQNQMMILYEEMDL